MEKPVSLDVRLVIPAVFKNELIAEATMRQVATMAGFTPEQIEEVETALGEACLNAIEHSRDKRVYVDITYQPEEQRMTIVVQDQGVGLDGSALTSPEIEQRLKSLPRRGFGVMLIEKFMDEIKFSEIQPRGTKVEMRKYRAAGGNREELLL